MALESAHEAGVIHRDLKPANVKLSRPTGKVKVLDFGLAKALEPDAVGSGSSGSVDPRPTVTSAGTDAGVILGTAAYMSPEQARGKPVDRRTDIWAFGCVLYEMLTGTRAFRGEDVSLTLAEVMKSEPDRDALPAATPLEIGRLLRRCLTKEPRRRLQAIGDARIEIEEALGGSEEPVEKRRAQSKLPWVVAIVIALIAGMTGWNLKPTPARQPVRFPITVSEGFPNLFFPDNVSLSRDGRTLVYAGHDQLYRRDIKELVARPISGTDGALSPVLSPDGKWIGFQLSESNLWKISASGGRPVPVCDFGRFINGLSWVPDDTMVFGSHSGLWRVSANGGDPIQISTLDEGEVAHTYPEILPGDDAVLFTIWRGAVDKSEVGLLSLETGEHRTLMDGMHPRYAATGHIVFARGGALWARPFDPDSLDLGGDAKQVLEDVSVEGFIGQRSLPSPPTAGRSPTFPAMSCRRRSWFGSIETGLRWQRSVIRDCMTR